MVKCLRLNDTWEYITAEEASATHKCTKCGRTAMTRTTPAECAKCGGNEFEELSKAEENPTVFILGVLDSETLGMIGDETTIYHVDPAQPNEEAGFKMNAAARSLMITQYGLRGWKNLQGANGKEVKFETENIRGRDLVKRDLLRQIPLRIVTELANEIMRGNTVTEDEAKN